MSIHAPFDTEFAAPRCFPVPDRTLDAPDNGSLTLDEVAKVEQACTERARDEAETNDPKFAEYVNGGMVAMSDVSVILSLLAKGTAESHCDAMLASDRIVEAWIEYRVDAMEQDEYDAITREVLELDLEEGYVDSYEAPV